MEESEAVAVCPRCGYVAGQPVDSLLHLTPGIVLKERYLVGRVLGDGGFGITYIGRDLVLDSKVAVKEYFPSGMAIRMRGEPDVMPASASIKKDYLFGLERFLDEARLVRKFKDHPNIVRVEDYFPEHDTAYMILEYLDGMTLEKFIEKEGGRLDWQPAVNCMMWVMDAMREVHTAGVLHRDISPDNIFLVRSGHVKVIDFGAARQAMGQKSLNLSVILKHGYAPFEQYESKGQQGPWTDVYAAAATLYRAVTGVMPAAAPDRFKSDTVVRPSELGIATPPYVEAALMKGLALRVEDRFADMFSMEQALQGKGVAASPAPLPSPQPPSPPTPVPTPVPVPKKLPWVAIAASVVLALLAGLWFLLRPGPPVVVKEFRAEPQTVPRGGKVTLQWDVADAQTVEIEGLGPQQAKGSAVVSPNENASYTLVAKPRRGEPLRKKLDVTVVLPAAARIVRLEVKPERVKAGELALLSWQVDNGTQVELDGLKVETTGSRELRLEESKEFRLEALGPDGVKQQGQVLLQVEPRAVSKTDVLPQRQKQKERDHQSSMEVLLFQAQPGRVEEGGATTLQWSVSGASRVSITPEPGQVALSGEVRLSPRFTTRYTLTAVDARGATVTAATQVEVGSRSRELPQRNPNQPPNQGPQNQTPQNQTPMEMRYSWPVMHDHQGLKALNPYDRTWNHCEGVLRVVGKRLRYETRFPGDSFDAPLSDVDEIKMNRIAIRGMKSFHVKLKSGRNFNFVSQESPDRIVRAIEQLLP